MATRGRGGGVRTVSKRPRGKQKKRQCEMGRGCPYQHEYQHQQEFNHDGAADDNADPSGGASGCKRKSTTTLAQHTFGALKGTGTRGRLVAVAADRRRAERAQRSHDQQNTLTSTSGVVNNSDGADHRDAQRARWVVRMQQQIQVQQQHQEQERAVGPVGHGEARESETRVARLRRTEARSRVPSPSCRGMTPLGAPELEPSANVQPEAAQSRPACRRPPGSTPPSGNGAGAAFCNKQREVAQIIDIDTDDTDASDHEGQASVAAAAAPPSFASIAVDSNEGQFDGCAGHGWECQLCTFQNGNDAGLACEVCGSERSP